MPRFPSIDTTGALLGAAGQWTRDVAARMAGPSVEHDMRIQDMRERLGRVDVTTPKTVTIVMDHGLTNFKSKVWPLIQARNLPVTLALNSNGWGSATNSGATVDDVKAWVATGLVEPANHGRDHNLNGDFQHDYDEIVGGRNDLETALATTIDSWVQTGNGAYDFADGNSLDKYWTTDTGATAYRSHAVGTGLLPNTEVYYDMDGNPVFGCKGGWIDGTAGPIQTAIGNMPEGKGYIVRFHPQFLDAVKADGTPYLTTAALTDFLDYLAGEVTAGNLTVLPFNKFQIANYAPAPEAPTAQDTGWRILTPSTGVTGSIFMKRVGKTVHMMLQGVTTSTSGHVAVGAVPFGFRIENFAVSLRHQPVVDIAGTSPRVTSYYAGNMRILSAVSGVAYDGYLIWDTDDPWPTALPGTAA